MYYGAIKIADCANGIGARTSFFVSGCTHHCCGCFQPQTWAFDYGKEYTKDVESFIIDSVRPKYIDGLTILGGEPMEPQNQKEIISLIRNVKSLGKSVWVYSGYTWEELTDRDNKRCRCEYTDEILSLIDVLVDGEFHQNEKDITLKFRGSSNQRVIDVQKTLKTGEIVNVEF